MGCLRAWAGGVDVAQLPPPAQGKIDFDRDIKPILEENCLRCHGPEKPKSQFRLDNRNSALKGGEQGVDIVPGDSAKSPLIHYVLYLVEDSEMPPVGKGKQLEAAQVSRLRAWIDQGVVWGATVSNQLDFAFSPILGGVSVAGHEQKFRELNWAPGGADGGAENFKLFKQMDADTQLSMNGHAVREDYEVDLSVDRAGWGYLHSGWQQYRKYFNDVGGYDSRLSPTTPSLGEDLHLDVGKAWADLGITVPDWPQVVLGYEYDYRQGREGTLEWNYSGTNSAAGRNTGPGSDSLHESVHTVKLDVNYDVKGVTLEDRFRGEFYRLSVGTTNVGFGPVQESVRESTRYFQGANTFRMEKKFTDWLFASGGYQYSKLNADSTFFLAVPTLLQSAVLPDITLERESNVGNINALIGPLAGFTLSAGGLADWTRQSGFGAGAYNPQSVVPVGSFLEPFAVDSDYDETRFEETATLRYSRIPFTSVYGEARLEQDAIGQYDQFAAESDILNKAVFLQHTDFSSHSSDLRAGFETSPWRLVSLNAHYRHYNDDSDYDSGPLIQPILTAYPTFIQYRDLNTDEMEARVVLHPAAFLSTTFSYEYHDTRYDVSTGQYPPGSGFVSPGGELLAGAERGQIFSVSATATPIRRLYLTAAASYEDSTLTTFANDSPTVAPYVGGIYTLLVNGTFVCNATTELFASYLFSEASYGQNNLAAGLPLGINYQRHSGQVGFSHRLGENVLAKLQYRFDLYREPTSGGANNYVAHAIYGTLSFAFR